MYRLDSAVWEITLKCNINCLHCGSSANSNKRINELSTDEALDLIEQLADIGCKRVVLSGGEPFLRKDWAVLALRIRDLGMNVTFISNGYVVNDDTVDLLKVINPSGVGISLDGGCAETHDYIRGKKGVFDRAVSALNKLSKAGFYTSAVTSVHKKNIAELDKILEILIDNGVSAWQIQSATPQGRMPVELAIDEDEFYYLAKYIAEKRKRYKNIIDIFEADCIGYYSTLSKDLYYKEWRGCQAGMRILGIESDGTIKGCLSLHGEEFDEGNIREKSLAEIWNDKNKFKLNRRFSPDKLQGICKKCKWGTICRGGCAEKAKSYTGSRFASPFCLYQYEKEHNIL